MKPALVVGFAAALGCALATVIWWPRVSPSAVPENPRLGSKKPATATPGMAGSDKQPREARTGSTPQTPVVDVAGRVVPGKPGPGGLAPARSTSPSIARVVGAGRRGPSGSGGTPRVNARLAFRALLYVGVDPEAEKTWMQAINDPNLPAGVRSDLIEDLNDEGYEDPSGNHLTKKDLPLILARLEIIERLAPYAMDKVNADAFEEAYKDLLNMYVRLGGSERK